MRFQATCLTLLLLLSAFSPQASIARSSNWIETDFASVGYTTQKHENPEPCDLFATYRLPWNWFFPSDWIITTRLNSTAGALIGGRNTGLILSIGPGTDTSQNERRFSIYTVSPQASIAESPNGFEMGFSAGVYATKKHEDFEQYDLFATYRLPWNWFFPSDWIIATRLNSTAGALIGGEETGLIISIGPGITVSKSGGRFSLYTGVSAALLSQNEFGKQDFGGPLQFLSHLGIRYQLSRHLAVSYQIQHMSNGHIYSSNPSMDLHIFKLSYCH